MSTASISTPRMARPSRRSRRRSASRSSSGWARSPPSAAIASWARCVCRSCRTRRLGGGMCRCRRRSKRPVGRSGLLAGGAPALSRPAAATRLRRATAARTPPTNGPHSPRRRNPAAHGRAGRGRSRAARAVRATAAGGRRPLLGAAWPAQPAGRFPLRFADISIGRALDNDVVLESNDVSRHHVRVEPAGTLLRLIDLGSTNGTRVNGRRVSEHLLRDGDLVELGSTPLLFRVGDPAASP